MQTKTTIICIDLKADYLISEQLNWNVVQVCWTLKLELLTPLKLIMCFTALCQAPTCAQT